MRLLRFRIYFMICSIEGDMWKSYNIMISLQWLVRFHPNLDPSSNKRIRKWLDWTRCSNIADFSFRRFAEFLRIATHWTEWHDEGDSSWLFYLLNWLFDACFPAVCFVLTNLGAQLVTRWYIVVVGVPIFTISHRRTAWPPIPFFGIRWFIHPSLIQCVQSVGIVRARVSVVPGCQTVVSGCQCKRNLCKILATKRRGWPLKIHVLLHCEGY